MSEIIDLTKNSIGNCKFMQHANFGGKYICVHGFHSFTIRPNWMNVKSKSQKGLQESDFFLKNVCLLIESLYILITNK